MRRGLLTILIVTVLLAGWSWGQGPLQEAMNTQVRSTSGGDLMVFAVSVGAQGPLTNFGNLRLRTYGGGDLGVAINGGTITPDIVRMGTGATVTVDAATTFAMTSTYQVLACTGAETINTITGGARGAFLVLENSDTDCTIADDDTPTAANAVDLTGTATNDVGGAAKIIVLVYTGASWMQVSESDN